ncbi:sensor histidine kinase [Streptomyces sp. NPDC050617]|uniref:sensor histidine kinase n=1 Tax=Streptomyces sp. NPDC050617 TaxID=3154628 RepID=UPI00344602B6
MPVNSGGGDPRPRGVRWREAAVTAAAFALCLLAGTVRDDGATIGAPPAAAYLLAVATCAVLPVRHRAPLAAMAVTTAGGLLAPLAGLLLSPPLVAPAVITAYSLAVRTEWRRAAGAVALAAATLLVATTPFFDALSWRDASRMAAVAAFPLMAGVLGNSVRNRRAYLAAMEERARRAEESREGEARRRVAEERVRIARELHDLVAHQITLANAQATVAAHFFDARPEQTRKSLHELIETTGSALDELRATVGLLRQTGDADEDGDTGAPAEPAPGLSRLPALLASFRRAGLEVSVRQEGTARPLPPGTDLTAYRIVQEALTNVTKHAGAGSARVRLVWGGESVTVSIADDGGDARTAPSTYAGPDRTPGYGLIGMRERATAVGGRLSAGRRAEGGFLVSAELPTARTAAGPADGGPANDGPANDGPADGGPADGGERIGGVS